MSRERLEADRRVIEKVRSAADGVSAAQIATAFLGARARRHKYRALEQIGLGIAARLCGTGQIQPTRCNRFVLVRSEVAA